jgi:gluconokinase
MPRPPKPTKNTDWFLGIDLGTGSCKSIVIDPAAAVLGFGVGDYAAEDTRDRWQEQDPEKLLRAAAASARAAVARAGVDAGRCAGMSLGGALHSILALDAHGKPLTGVITWADGRAAAQADAVRGRPLAQTLYNRTGCPAHGMYPLYKIIWLREQRPDIVKRTWRFVSAKEYVFARLTGEHRVDPCLAAGSGLLNTHSLTWEPLCLDTAGIRPDQLSPPCSPRTVHKGLSAAAARRLGLPRDVAVVLGSADAANSNLGAGAVSARRATCMVGTSGAFRVICPAPVLDPKGRSWCYAIDESHWLVGGAINNGGVALAWLRDCLNQALSRDDATARPLSYEDVLALASRCKPGAGGVICLPLFAGERSPNWNLNARAVFFGLGLEHGASHLCRALVEGIAFRFRNLNEVLAEVGVDVREIVASGGFTKSAFWLQVITDALNREMSVPRWGETSCLGAAFWAMLAADAALPLEALAQFVQLGTTCVPDGENAAVYDRLYPLFTRLYSALTAAFDEAARLRAPAQP